MHQMQLSLKGKTQSLEPCSQMNDLFSNMYNEGWRNVPNLSWRNQGITPMGQPGFPGQSQGSQYLPSLAQEKKPSVENMMLQYIQKLEQITQSQQASIQRFEKKVGPLSKGITEKGQDKLPSTTQVNPKEATMAITLRSGKVLDDPEAKVKPVLEKKNEVKVDDGTEKIEDEHDGLGKKCEDDQCIKVPEVKTYVPLIPFLQRFKKKAADEIYQKFVGMFKKLQVNMPFSEVLANILAYAKFSKEIVSNKKKLKDFAEVSLTEECNAILQNHLLIKMKDPGSFTVPCQFEHLLVDKCLCDLGSSVNLMPLSFFRKLKFTNLVPTQVILQLADHSVCYPMGIVEDLLVKVGKFYFPTDFIVFDMEEDISIAIILGRGFLATRGATIDLLEGKLTLKVGTEKEEFNVFEPLKYPSYEESCSYIAATDELYGEKCLRAGHRFFAFA
ncbi:uncharacterized protein [Coffea arabica]|uniref:Uncharacterized protein n=1 Tax=Coffea arabica TaxID=13443 RepID=A0A6P6UJ77_COFAR|nr:uncharacterized protein LOC113711361 [Coffea arabica]